MSYKSERSFQMWSYTTSHCFVVIRSPNREIENWESGYNIDIEFEGVCYFDLPTILKGVCVNKIDDNIPSKFDTYLSNDIYTIFEIQSSGNKYYVIAENYIVGRNNWISECRIDNLSLVHDEILAHS